MCSKPEVKYGQSPGQAGYFYRTQVFTVSPHVEWDVHEAALAKGAK